MKSRFLATSVAVLMLASLFQGVAGSSATLVEDVSSVANKIVAFTSSAVDLFSEAASEGLQSLSDLVTSSDESPASASGADAEATESEDPESPGHCLAVEAPPKPFDDNFEPGNLLAEETI